MRVQRLFYYLWYCWWFNNDSIQPIFSLVGVSLLPIQRQQPRRSNGPEGYGSIPWLARPGQHYHQHQAATGPTSTMLASSIPSSSGSTSNTALEPPAITMDHLSCTHDGGEHWQLKDVSFVLPRGASTYIPTHTHAHSVYRNVPLCVSSVQLYLSHWVVGESAIRPGRCYSYTLVVPLHFSTEVALIGRNGAGKSVRLRGDSVGGGEKLVLAFVY
jgi:ABC-type multidrug transport system fused ATPase/permease subunit